MNNTKRNKHLGGGEEHKNPLFKPLIATSLAVALGVSVAVATEPSIQTSTDETLQDLNIAGTGVSWNGSNGGGTDGFYTLIDSSNRTPVNIILQFTSNGNGTGSLSGDTYTISQNGTMGANQTPILQLSTTDRGIDMQGKTLTLDFLGTDESNNSNWNPSDNTTKRRKINLNLSGTSLLNNRNIAFQGNIDVKAGKQYGIGLTNYHSANELDAIFGGDVVGDIRVLHSIYTDPTDSDLEYPDITANFTFNSEAQLQGNIQASAGESTFAFQNNGVITGNIITKQQVQDDCNTTSNIRNRVVFVGGNVAIGSEEKKSELLVDIAKKVNLSGQMGSNTIITHSGVTQADFHFNTINVNGDMWPSWEGKGINKNFNALSFNNMGNNSVSVDSVTPHYGYTIIGKNLATYNETSKTIAYDSTLFSTDPNMSNAVILANNLASNFTKSEYTASGTYTFGDITANPFSANYISVQNLVITGTVKATTTIEAQQNGGLSGKNYIFANGVTNITGHIISTKKDQQAPASGHNNLLILRGTSVTLGGGATTIKIDNADPSTNQSRYSNNTILLDATTTNLNISEIYIASNYSIGNKSAKNFNALSFNNSSGNGNKSIATINASYGNNIIGKNIATLDSSEVFSYDSTLFGSDSSDPTMQSGFIAEFIKSTHSANGNFILGDNSSSVNDAIITANGGNGANYLNLSGTTTIKGNIKAQVGGVGNVLVLTGTSATLGESGKEISIISNNPSSGFGRTASNTILFGASSTALNISTLSVSGDWKSGETPYKNTFNILSFNNASDTGSKNITTISAKSGNNVIGKDLITQDGGYNTTLFGDTNSPSMQSNFIAEFIQSTHSASGNFTLGSISTTQNGANFFNLNGTTSIQGNIQNSATGAGDATSGHNNIIILTGTSATLGTDKQKISIGISNVNEPAHNITSNNTILLGANTNALNLSGISVNGTWTSDTSKNFNALSFNSDSGTGAKNLGEVSASNGSNIIGKNLITQANGYDSTLFNSTDIISPSIQTGNIKTNFLTNAYTAKGTFTLDSITANGRGINYFNVETLNTLSINANDGGTNYIYVGSEGSLGKVSASGSGVNNIKADSGTYTIAGISTKDYKNYNTGNTLDLGSATLTINVRSGDTDTNINGKAIYAKNGNNTNTIKAQIINIDGEVYASGDATTINSIEGVTMSVTGNITPNSGKNNFTFTADSGTLTLKGQNNRITTLTAKSDATNGDTLILDATNNDSIVASVDTVTNGEKLIVDFKGIDDTKSTQLTLNTTTSQNLKDVSVASGTNNTLILSGTNTMTIADAVTIGDNSRTLGKGITFDLRTGSSLTFSSGLSTTANGITTFKLGGTSNTLAGSLTNNGIHNFDVMSATTTLQYDTGLTFTGGENNINFNVANSTLNWKDNAGADSKNIITNGTGATTNLNFIESGILASGIENQNGSTTINIYDNKNGTINGAVSTTSGTTNINFASGENAKSLTLVEGNNTLTSITFGENNSTQNTINLRQGKTTFSGAINVGSATTNQALAFSLSDGTELALTTGLTTGSNGVTTLSVVADATNGVILSGGSVGLTNLNMALGSTNASTLTFKNTSTTIGTLTSGASDSVVNKLVMGEGSTSVSVGNTANGAKFNLDFSDTSNNSKTFTLQGGTNTIKQLTVADTGANTLAISGGSTTINSISDLTGKDFTLALSSDNTTPSNTLATLDSAISGAKATFAGGVADQVHFSELLLKGSGANTLSSVTTSASNAKIILESISSAEISSFAFSGNGSMLLGFTGTGDSTLTLNNSVTVGSGQALGISIGGSGTRALKVAGNIAFDTGSTLVIDFQKTAQATDKITATLGQENKAFTIGTDSNSIINLRGGAGTSTLNGSIELTGGINTINFIDTATMGDVITLRSGTNYINVYAGTDESHLVVGTMAVSKIGGVNNTISLASNSKLNLTDSGGTAGSGELKTTATNILNFNGANATLEGGFGAGVSDDGSTTGTATINVKNVGAVITGNVTNASVSFSDTANSTLTLKGTTNTINSLSATGVTGSKVILDSTSNQVDAILTSSVTGDAVGLKFGSGSNAKKFTFQEADNTLSGIELDTNTSTNNTVALSKGKTTFTELTEVGVDQGIIFELANNTELSLDGGLYLKSNGSSTLKVASNGSATLSGGQITLTEANLSGENSTLTLSAQNTNIATLNANATTGNILALDSTNNNVVATIGTISNTNNNLTLAFKGNATYSNTLNLENKTIQNINVISGANNNVVFSGNSNTIAQTSVANGSGIAFQVNDGAKLSFTGALDNSNGGNISFDLKNGSELTLHESSTINSLSANNATIDIHNMDANPVTRGVGNQLVIGNNGGSYKGVASFIVDVGASGVTDTVVFKSIVKQDNGSKSEAVIKVLGSYDDIINKAADTLVAKVYDTGYNTADGSTANMEVVGGKSLVGGSVIEVLTLNQQINYDSISYYIGKVKDEGAPVEYQEVASSALTVNYDLFLANFNSLNKRMGELRDDANSNGVWARVFGGAMSNDFGAGSKTEYITAQAGYDYSLSVGNNARNFMGIAVAYGTSDTKGNALSMNGLAGASNSISLDKVNSNMVEVGLYNSYVADSGWYNDTIFKFDYIMSEFSLSNDPSTMSSTNNFAMVLSDEFGYRYKFAENEKGSWYVDPQLELAFGYFNQSDFNREMYNVVGTSTTMRAQQDAILTLRTRVGASLGKKFNTDKGFASVYVGAFYEYDYINGGNASVEGQIGGTIKSLDSIESNGRAMLNIGSNIELTKGARLYIDVEKSFGDKQRTFMQFNLGARYSF